MAKTFYDQDADLNLIKSKKVAVIGYGSQGHAHALNLRDSGVEVRVGLREGSSSRAKAESAGLEVRAIDEAAGWADVVMILAPDTAQPDLFAKSVAPHLKPGDTLMFSHGFNIRFGAIRPPEGVDVSMVAPKAPGHRVRETYQQGQGTPALAAVERDASGSAFDMALSYARALGCTRAGVIQTTFAEEAETDLFGEQAVLCGGVSQLIKAAYETLVEAGYQPEVAYFECMHELKLIVDLMYRGGLNFMRYSVSETAEYGDYTAGPRVIGEAVRSEMRRLLDEIQDGSFAKRWIEECEKGQPEFRSLRTRERYHDIEEVGAQLRRKMPFLESVEAEETEAHPVPEGEGGSDQVVFF